MGKTHFSGIDPGSFTVEDGNDLVRVARATYDFAEHGGAIGNIGLGVTLPDNAVILDGVVDVITTLTSATDAATVAVQAEAPNDIVAAIAISDVSNPWDAGRKAIVPDGTAANSKKTTQSREITAVVGAEAVTAGKFVVFLRYVVSD